MSCVRPWWSDDTKIYEKVRHWRQGCLGCSSPNLKGKGRTLHRSNPFIIYEIFLDLEKKT